MSGPFVVSLSVQRVTTRRSPMFPGTPAEGEPETVSELTIRVPSIASAGQVLGRHLSEVALYHDPDEEE